MLPIIMDVDTGIDDALALIVAEHRPGLDIVAVTTVAGNVGLTEATANTRAVLGLTGRGDLPVAAGARAPLVRPHESAGAIHGPSGLGHRSPLDVGGMQPPLRAESAAELICRMTRERPGELTLVATGPLTNVALALSADPGLAKRLRRIVVMGGALDVPGNVTPVAEFNFWIDPEAAQIVLACDAPVTLVPLDVTRQVTLDRAQVRALADRRPSSRNPALLDLSIDLLDFYLAAYERHGHATCALHDPLAVLVAARRDLVEKVPTAVEVECAGTLTRGQCIVDRRPRTELHPAPRFSVEACLGVDATTSVRLICDALAGSE